MLRPPGRREVVAAATRQSTVRRPGDAEWIVPDTRFADRAGKTHPEEVSDKWMRAHDVAGVRAALTEEAVTFAVLDQGARCGLGDLGRDRSEREIDGLEERGAHQEVLEVVAEVADDLLGQVLVEVALGAAQRGDEGADLRGIRSWMAARTSWSDAAQPSVRRLSSARTAGSRRIS